MEQTIEIPADAKTVTLELKGNCALTLRALLPKVRDEVELVIRDEFGTDIYPDADLYRLDAGSGDALLDKLERSRVVDGESILGLTPEVRFVNPTPSMINGSLANLSGTGYIQLVVRPQGPGKEG